VLYVGTLGDDVYEILTGWLLNLAGVKRLLAAPEGIEVTERWQGERRLLFVLNHTEHEQEITLDCCYQDLLGSSTILQGTLPIAPRDVLVLSEERR
jgi:beta-galactosidase GanA